MKPGVRKMIFLGQVNSQKDYLAEICSQIHQVPYYGPEEFIPKTFSCWLLDYRQEGFDGLKPQKTLRPWTIRKLSREFEEHLLALRTENEDYLFLSFMISW